MSEEPRSFYDSVKGLVPAGKYPAKILSVYDGDTVWALLKPLNMKVKIRMTEINTAEMKGGTPETREQACSQRDFVRSLIDQEEVIIKISTLDKYFRHLGTIYVPEPLWKKVGWVDQTARGDKIVKITHEDSVFFNLSEFMLTTGICGRYITKR